MNSVTRSYCPLNCGWYHDQSAFAQPEGIDPLAYKLLAAQLQEVETAIRAHLETHELIEWVQAIARLKGERDRLRGGMEGLFTRWFLNAHAGLDFREAMMGIAADLRAVLDGTPRATPDSPLTSSNTVDNQEQQ